MEQVVQLFHHARNGLGEEVASADLPGELWPAVEELAQRQQALFTPYRPMDLTPIAQPMLAVDLEEYLKLKGTPAEQGAVMRTIVPYAESALELGYHYLVLTA